MRTEIIVPGEKPFILLREEQRHPIYCKNRPKIQELML
jgi:hypothetical protein